MTKYSIKVKYTEYHLNQSSQYSFSCHEDKNTYQHNRPADKNFYQPNWSVDEDSYWYDCHAVSHFLKGDLF